MADSQVFKWLPQQARAVPGEEIAGTNPRRNIRTDIPAARAGRCRP